MSTNALESVDLLVVGGGKAGKSLAMERCEGGLEGRYGGAAFRRRHLH